MTRQRVWTAAMVLGGLLLAGPTVAGQASMLDASEATAFLGTWVISMENPRGGGTRDQTVALRDEGGKVAARIEGGRGGALDITDISKDGDSLVLSFERSGRGGNTFPIVLTLTLDGDMINASQDIGGGRFTISGSGKKQESPDIKVGRSQRTGSTCAVSPAHLSSSNNHRLNALRRLLAAAEQAPQPERGLRRRPSTEARKYCSGRSQKNP